MKALICGVGRMGQTIGYAMDAFGYDLAVVEPVRENIGKLEALINKNICHISSITTEQDVVQFNPDIVISSMPYFENKKVGEICIKAGIRYCDLGGRVDVSQQLNEVAQKDAVTPIFTDLGLAPGWVNILAEQGYEKVHDATDVKMMVGGIPLHRPRGPMGYVMTWSLDGLLNEYRDDCEILENGKIKTVPGLARYEIVDPEWEGCTALESFCTSGGAAHTTSSMKQRGVKNCVYKTLRWMGHHNLLDFFMNRCEMSDNDLLNIFNQSAKCEVSQEDVVIIIAQVRNDTGLTWRREITVNSDVNFTAMQRSTAFSISTIASLMGEGELDDKSSNSLSYSDVPFDEFNARLDGLLNK